MEIDFPSLDPNAQKLVSVNDDLIHLTKPAIEEWLPRISCDKCGRHKICAYANQDPDDKCTVIQSFIKNIFQELNEVYSLQYPLQRSKTLKSLYSLTRFAFESELYVGYFQIPNFIKAVYSENITNRVIGSVANIKGFADQFLTHSRDIDELKSRGVVLLTEGASELAFLIELYPNRSFEVEDYDGDGNKKKLKLLPLIRHYYKRGYRVFAQSDLDGKKCEKMDLRTTSATMKLNSP